MTVDFSLRTSYEVSAERLFELLTDPGFLERKALDFGADEAKVTREVESDGTLVVTTKVKEPAHWGKGQQAWTLVTRFVGGGLEGSWIHELHGSEARSRVEGTIRFEPRGDARCDYVNEGLIEIRVPMMGKMIEKKIKAGIEAGVDKERAYIARKLREAA